VKIILSLPLSPLIHRLDSQYGSLYIYIYICIVSNWYYYYYYYYYYSVF